MALRANKYSHIRAALVYNDEIAKLSREHNNANVICLGSRFCTVENAQNWINIFLNTTFSEGRHALVLKSQVLLIINRRTIKPIYFKQ